MRLPKKLRVFLFSLICYYVVIGRVLSIYTSWLWLSCWQDIVIIFCFYRSLICYYLFKIVQFWTPIKPFNTFIRFLRNWEVIFWNFIFIAILIIVYWHLTIRRWLYNCFEWFRVSSCLNQRSTLQILHLHISFTNLAFVSSLIEQFQLLVCVAEIAIISLR